MFQRIKVLVFLVAILLIALAGFKLRLKQYANVPFKGDSVDEYSNAWAGISTIKFGKPIGISDLPAYKDPIYRYINVDRIYQGVANGNPLIITEPWLDHPPLMPILTGAYSVARGANVFEDAVTDVIRRPIIYLSIITIVLCGILGYLVGGKMVGILAALLYATSPLIIIGNRMVQAENGMVPFFLFCLIFLHLFLKRASQKYLWLAGIAAAIAILFKISGIVAIVSGIILIAKQSSKKDRVKNLAVFTLVALSGFVVYCLWGIYFDKELFMKVLFANSNRNYGIGFGAIANLLSVGKIAGDKAFSDGLILMGWLGLLMILRSKAAESYRVVIVGVFSYLSIYLIFGSASYGWYRFPFLPLITISLAITIIEFLRKPQENTLTNLILLIGLGVNLQQTKSLLTNPSLTTSWRLFSFFLPIYLLIRFLNQKDKRLLFLDRLIAIGLIAIFICINLKYANMITLDYWYGAN